MQPKRFYKGLYGADSIEFAKGLVNVHPFGEIGRQHDGQVKLHAHNNLFQIFVVETGTTELHQQSDKMQVTGPAFITVPKNHEHGFLHGPEVTGWIISLADTVLESMLQREAEVIYGLDDIHVMPVSEAEPEVWAAYQIMQQCVQEYRHKRPGRLLMLQYLVGQLLVQLYRLSLGEEKISTADNVSRIYFRRFQQLIKEAGTYKKSVEAYAQDLKISTGHLNRVCRNLAGKAPKDFIIDYFITEAQLNLSQVERSVSEIGYALGFEDPAYFTRLFKKRTGQTPVEFRKQIGVKIT
ncbi:helix-turn-helix domain-containing protein [Adhaeribacter sp. BT258]|uniref:Helix-turn-helix domain-containing protein n=1 Tax=Adhaeribacter terrigena TaxID=2793070 RepID=A0ABS1C0F1_9BACT|nr:AraC family transcriptional regulator [Adhaeribacter terrigena]MBK0402803.1 helix-turn-helix domain-containing protein [Adhaeribacter terrigena]